MIKSQELVSIIMPAYNAGRFIKDSIASVLAQSYPSWELIIVDDGSTDGTASIVKEFCGQDKRIIYHYQDNQRLGAARNTGFRLAKGTWIAFLDADDLWTGNKLEIQMDAANAQVTSPDVIFTSGWYLAEDGTALKPYDSLTGYYTGRSLYPLLMRHNHIPVLSVIMSRKILMQTGFQDTTNLVYGNEDWDFWLRACRAGASFLGLAQRAFRYRVHAEAMSAKKPDMLVASCYVLSKNYDRAWLSADDQLYHRRMLWAKIPFLAKRLLKTRAGAGLIKLLFRILSISFPVVFEKKET